MSIQAPTELSSAPDDLDLVTVYNGAGGALIHSIVIAGTPTKFVLPGGGSLRVPKALADFWTAPVADGGHGDRVSLDVIGGQVIDAARKAMAQKDDEIAALKARLAALEANKPEETAKAPAPKGKAAKAPKAEDI